MAVTDSNGTLTFQQRYLPFGEECTDIPSPQLPITDLGYTGQRQLDDGLGGIMDYRARFYSPALMRFLQPDTIIPNPANPQAYNRYSYANNNPIKYNDPTGHCPVCIVALIGIAIVLSQIPSDTAHDCSSAHPCGDPNVVGFGLTVTIAAPDIVGLAGEGLMGLGKLINSPRLWAAGYNAYNATNAEVAAAAESSGYKIRPPLKVAKDYEIDPESSPVTSPYVRPSYSVTDEQRAAVQGKPCVYCGQITDNQIVDHKLPLSIEYYKTGSIDIENMRSVEAVQPSCPSCSFSQGAELSWFSKFMKGLLFGNK